MNAVVSFFPPPHVTPARRLGARVVVMLTAVVLTAAGLALSAHGQDADTTATYTVQQGDTLYGIAREAGVSVRALRAWNDLSDDTLAVGQVLQVRPPASSGSASSPTAAADSVDGETTPADSAAATTPPPYGRYTAEVGDTFVSLALRLGLPADSLVALNDSLAAATPSDSLRPGATVRLPRAFGPPTHVVQPGETLYAIAGEYGASVRALQRANDIASTTLSPGQRLRIPGRAPVLPDTLAAPDTTGRVAPYPSTFAGRLTASGQTYDPNDRVGSHPTLPYGAVVLLTNPRTDASVFVRIIDRGPVEDNLLMDVSDAVATSLGLSDGNAPVELRVVWLTPPS